jgi:hypothetical protein
MRVYKKLLASTDSIGASSLLSSRPTALLPPIPLYRRVLRAHRKLPKEHRVLGDLYVKSEFRAHKDVDNPVHIVCLLQDFGELYLTLCFRSVSLVNGRCTFNR